MSTAAAKPLVRFLDDLRQAGGLRGVDVANIAGVSRATASCWAKGQKTPNPPTQLVLSRLHYVVMCLREYYDPGVIRAWLYARHPQLQGERAVNFIRGDRSHEVLAILDRLDAEVYL